MGAVSLTWEKKYREPFGKLIEEVDFISYNNVEKLEEAVTDETAAVFLEPIQGEGGIRPATRKFLQAARDLTEDHGALLIMDEIQSGVGRTGAFLASEHYLLEPDMVTLAKGLGGGVPIGALLMTDEVAGGDAQRGSRHHLWRQSARVGGWLSCVARVRRTQPLRARQARRAPLSQGADGPRVRQIREVRGVGLMIGVELKEKAAPYISALRDAGVITINAGATVIRLCATTDHFGGERWMRW